MIKKYISAAASLFYPHYCLFDEEKISDENNFCLCESCLKKIKPMPSAICLKCALPMYLGEEQTAQKSLNFVCQHCAGQKNHFKSLRSACLYEGIIKDCIHLFKYKQKLALRKLFSNLLIQSFQSHFAAENYDLLIAVPMHPLKKFFREFNHSEILARELFLQTKIELSKKNLKRIKFSRSQTKLDAIKRKQNVKNAFSVSKPHQIRGKKILLIDDVATTLSTVNECSKQLCLSGANFVDVLTVARGGI